MKELKTGMRLFSVATGNFNPLKEASRKALDKIATEDKEIVAVYPTYPGGTLLFYETENEAKRARNRLVAWGFPVGNNICECVVQKDGTLAFVGIPGEKDKIKRGL